MKKIFIFQIIKGKNLKTFRIKVLEEGADALDEEVNIQKD
jgi:hypothetical protein